MKKLVIVLGCLALVFAFSTQVVAKKDKPDCTTIQDGTLKTTDGRVITTGYDEWGYNYQAHMFNGFYCDAYRDAAWCQDYKEDELMMKWNDAWLSNKDCDGDGLLDRHYGFDTYIGSGAWLTNHQWGSYLGNWDLTGDWVLEFDYLGKSYVHDMVLVDNTFTGTGGYPAGSPPYSVTWTVEGIIDGDNIDMRIEYDDSTYYVDVVGTIAQDGTMSGTWGNLSQSGTWESTSGAATGEK